MIDDETPFTTPKQLAERIGCSVAQLRYLIRLSGAGRKFGSKIILLPEDVDLLMEAVKILPRDYSLINAVERRKNEKAPGAALVYLRNMLAENKRKDELAKLPPDKRHPSGDPELRPGENLRQMRARMARERREKLAQEKRDNSSRGKKPKSPYS